ncbi:MAG TPA: hypothetical protein VGL72_31525 [Bryobacteraceae bacterium]|jgi:hypothetical protein
MLFVSFHGAIPNIYGFDETHPGSAAITDLIESSTVSQLSELRGMLLANGYLYLVNGGSGVSNVLCCSPDPNSAYHYTIAAVFLANSDTTNHPFDLTYQVNPDKSQTWWVSNQDSNVVAVFTAQAPFDSASAGSSQYLSALLSALQKDNSPLASPAFLTGTFVPTSVVAAEIPAQTVVDPAWGGLSAVFNPPVTTDASKKKGKKPPKPKVQNSVRGVEVYNGVLYVADEGDTAVRMFDAATGVPLGATTLDGPVHLVRQGNTIYVTSGNSVYSGTCVSLPATIPALPAKDRFKGNKVPPYPAPPADYGNSVTLKLTDLGLDLPSGGGPSGIASDNSGNLFVALRKTSEIYAFAPNTSGSGSPFTPWSTNPIFSSLGDEPEYLLWTETVVGSIRNNS